MKFKEVDVKIGDETFTVKEGTLQETLPILSSFSNPDGDKLTAQIDLLKLVVYRDGKRMGDSVGDVPQSAFTKLMSAALEVCGMSGGGD